MDTFLIFEISDQTLYQSQEDRQMEEYILNSPDVPCGPSILNSPDVPCGPTMMSQNQQQQEQLNYFIANRKLSSQLQPPTTLSLGSL